MKEDASPSLSHTILPTSVPHLSPTKGGVSLGGVSLEAALECEMTTKDASAEEAAAGEATAGENASPSLSHTMLRTSVPHLTPTKDGMNFEAALDSEMEPGAAAAPAAFRLDESAGRAADTPNTRLQESSPGATSCAHKAVLNPACTEAEAAPVLFASQRVQAAQTAVATPPVEQSSGAPTPRRSSKRQRAAFTEADAEAPGSSKSLKTRSSTSSKAATSPQAAMSPAPGPLTAAVQAVSAAVVVVNAVVALRVYTHSGLCLHIYRPLFTLMQACVYMRSDMHALRPFTCIYMHTVCTHIGMSLI